MTHNKIKILLVDDHAIMRMGLSSLLGTCDCFDVVGDAGDAISGINKALTLRPDVVIMDLMMPDIDGVEATRQLIRKFPCANILILTTFGSADGLAHALEAGARGAIMKSAAFAELTKAIKTVAAGATYVSPEIQQMISEDPPVPILTSRQAEILKSVTRGLSNVDIAKQFDISLQMVKEHMTVLLEKLGAANRAEAVAIALRKHLLKI